MTRLEHMIKLSLSPLRKADRTAPGTGPGHTRAEDDNFSEGSAVLVITNDDSQK